MELISQKYKELYTELHKNNTSYGGFSSSFVDEISLMITYVKPSSVLDYGCGKGSLVKALSNRFPTIRFHGYDPCISEYNEIKLSRYDMIVNTDVLEHIEEERIYDVLKHMKSLSNSVFFNLHHREAGTRLPNGENAHITIKPPHWYHKIIREIWGLCTPLISRHEPSSCAVTFELSPPQIFDYSWLVIQHIHSRVNALRAQIKAKS